MMPLMGIGIGLGFSRGGEPPVPETHYCFIDGASLRAQLKKTSERFFGGVQLDLNFGFIGRSFTKVFFYDAIPVREEDETEAAYETRIAPMRAIFEAAASSDRVHVYEGDARRRKRRGLEQKKVDVQLAVDMLTHTFRRNMQKATLFTGDSDFQPLVDALVREGMFVTLMYPPGETSRELMQAADARKPMTLSWLRGWLTEESGKKFALPLTENRDPRLKIDGECVATWEFGNRKHEYIRTATDHVITREHDSANKLYVEHPNSELLELFCREQDIHVPAGVLTGANRALPPPQPRS
jgi:uncharacterized LabA/DUF88 family protein